MGQDAGTKRSRTAATRTTWWADTSTIPTTGTATTTVPWKCSNRLPGCDLIGGLRRAVAAGLSEMSSEWQPPRSAFPPLQIAVVHLDEPSAAALDSELNLSPFELSLARCLAGPLAASRYRRARAALRVLLARVSGVKPVELVLNGASGRLAAAEGGELRYSLSMSGHLAAIALSADREVGVRAAVQQMAFPRGFAAALRSLRAGE